MSPSGQKALEATVMRAREDLASYDLDEAAVSAGSVKRLLDALGWDVFDPQAVCPEFKVGNGRVDYALRTAPAKIDFFMEVKAPGKANEPADKQLFEYTVHHGVPLALVTDGRVWSFYLPGGQGNYEERRPYRLDLLERELAASCERLDRYLGHDRVASGAAFDAASQDYKDKARELRVSRALPVVRRRLLDEPDELPIALLAEAIERENGEHPPESVVAGFLRTRAAHPSPAPVQPAARPHVKAGFKGVARGRAWILGPGKRLDQLPRRQTGRSWPLARVEAPLSRVRGALCASQGRAQAGADCPQPRKPVPGQGRLPVKGSQRTGAWRGFWFVGARTNPEEFEKRSRAACAAVGLEFGRDVIASFRR